ncbi:MAG: hypothetical protein KDC92_12465 [Bacteroidetes bacterium]|nr:hypothetical protein [Bacteroidota bacterium]
MASLTMALFASCVHEPIPPIPTPSLPIPLYRNAIPIAEITEPGCEPQMEIDSMSHRNYPRDSVYIRDLAVNPNNPNQWVYVESFTSKAGWEILWFVDLQAKQKRQLDSSYFNGYGSLTFNGKEVAFILGYEAYLLDISRSEKLSIGRKTNLHLSPNGEYIIFSTISTYLSRMRNSEILQEWPRGVGKIVWQNDSKSFITSSRNLNNNEHYLTQVDINGLKSNLFTKDENIGVVVSNSLNENLVFLSWHNIFNLETKSIYTFYPYCDRQYFEKIIPLRTKNEYLAIKWYKETVEPTKTLNYGYFHVFEEGGVNERRVTLNFDQLEIVK